jgi:hypothetical protein
LALSPVHAAPVGSLRVKLVELPPEFSAACELGSTTWALPAALPAPDAESTVQAVATSMIAAPTVAARAATLARRRVSGFLMVIRPPE